MKNYFILLTIGLFFSCKGEETKTDQIELETQVPVPEIDSTNNQTTSTNKSGETVEYHPNGEVKMRGKLSEAGTRQGLWVSFYDNGVKWSESYYVNGVLDGHSLTFFPNGNVRYVGEYKNGERIGTWKFYDESGELVKEENF